MRGEEVKEGTREIFVGKGIQGKTFSIYWAIV